MTKNEFWNELDKAWTLGDMTRFWEIWNTNPQFVKEWHEEFEKDMADPNSKRRKEHDIWWANLKSKLISSFGEEWVKENCKD